MLDVDEVRHAIEQAGDIADAAGALELRGADKFLLDRDQIDRARALDQIHHLSIDDPMRVQVEIFGPESFENPIVVFIVDEYRAENGFFGVDVMWKSSFERLTRHKKP